MILTEISLIRTTKSINIVMSNIRLKHILIALIPTIISLGVVVFFNSDAKADVYLFYNHARYIDNIFFDISNLMTFVIFSYWASRYDNRAFMPFFWLSLIELAGYFLFYKQFITLVSMPMLVILLIYYNNKDK